MNKALTLDLVPLLDEQVDYDFNESAEKVAAKRGQKVVYPLPNQLQFDFDDEESFVEFNKRVDFFFRDIEVGSFSIEMHPSASGLPHRHVTMTFSSTRVFTDWERIALQSVLGSDPVREFLNAMRFFEYPNKTNPSRLFEVLTKEEQKAEYDPYQLG